MALSVVRGGAGRIGADAVLELAARAPGRFGALRSALSRGPDGRRPGIRRAVLALLGRIPRAGEAALIEGANAPAGRVLLAAAPLWRGGLRGEEELLRRGIRSALELAAARDLRSVAIPLAQAGLSGYPFELAFRAMAGEVGAFLRQHDLDVRFAVSSGGPAALEQRLDAAVAENIAQRLGLPAGGAAGGGPIAEAGKPPRPDLPAVQKPPKPNLEAAKGAPGRRVAETGEPPWSDLLDARKLQESGLEAVWDTDDRLSPRRADPSAAQPFPAPGTAVERKITEDQKPEAPPRPSLSDARKLQEPGLEAARDADDRLSTRSADPSAAQPFLAPDTAAERKITEDQKPEAPPRPSLSDARRLQEPGLEALWDADDRLSTRRADLSAPRPALKPEIPGGGRLEEEQKLFREPAPPARMDLSFPLRRRLDDLGRELDDPFSIALMRLIDRKGLTDAQVYRRANIDRKLFSKIRNVRYRPGRNTVLALCIGLELNLDETRDLMGRAGYALSRSSLADRIVECFIENRHFVIDDVNAALYRYNFPTLSG